MTPNPLRRWWPLAAVAVLLALAAFAAVHSDPQLGEVGGGPEPRESVPPRSEPPPRTAPPRADSVTLALPDWLGRLAGGLCVALMLAAVAAGAAFMLRDRLRRRVRPPEEPTEPARRSGAADDVVAAVDAGLTELDDADADPRRAVIACWVRLEEAAAAAGTLRHAADTSTELVTRLLADHAVSAGVLAGFAAVYREARYATHTVDERMRAQAGEALRRLRSELTATTAGGGP